MVLENSRICQGQGSGEEVGLLIIYYQTIIGRQVVSYQIFFSSLCENAGYSLLQGRATSHSVYTYIPFSTFSIFFPDRPSDPTILEPPKASW